MLQGSPTQPIPPPRARLDIWRYQRLLIFFGRMFLDILAWEIVVRRLLGRRIVARGRSKRLRRYALRFRNLAVRMGGVMIKLGQFISARVDVMPPEITDELAGLQDEVPPEDLPPMLRLIEAELGSPARDLFAEFDTEVQAAASLGQVYRARLHSGERVVVKVQRPGIERLVTTDLLALEVVARWAMLWPLIRKRADVPTLLREFARTLWEELDYVTEAGNAERFLELFADDARVYIPAVYREYSSRRVLTLEDVTSIKILDHQAIEAAGVDRRFVAQRLFDMYLQMIFEFGFFHADPHPGNLFIYPLPQDAIEQGFDNAPPGDGHPFYLVFVDFGMVGRITDQVRAGLREVLVAVATRDTKRVIKAYQMLGVLLPGADLARIEEAEREVLAMIWGKSIPELANMKRSDMAQFALRYRDLLFELPFQVPQDFIYLARAVGILSGMCTLLDPEFNIWAPLAAYAQCFITTEVQSDLRGWLDEALALGQIALGLPGQAQDVLSRLQRGNLEVRFNPGSEYRGDLRRLQRSARGTSQAIVFAGLLMAATLLYVSDELVLGLIGYGLAGLTLLIMLIGSLSGSD